MMDTYENIYERYKSSGLRFDYNNHRIGKSKVIFRDDIKKINSSKSNNEDIPLFVNCKRCETYMNYYPGNEGIFNSWWKCPTCGTRVKESTVYNQLNKENSNYLDNINYDEEPEACQACGGPYPQCITSCKLYN